MTQVALDSAQKKLTQAYQQYTKSVKVDQVIEKNKQTTDLGLGSTRKTDESGEREGGERIDRITIDLSDFSYPTRVPESLPFDYYLNEKPPGRME